MDEISYSKKQDAYFLEHEALCKRCGRCCGADTAEPCSNLVKDPSGKFYCKSYENRLGLQRTISGRTFTCVDIRDVLAKGLPYEGCGYAA
ncbi:MAG: hypothetical protein Q8R38_01015 [Candidatus Omnitrophota bacterium]|nr:hypothetical protein [Candidatus Omnitrophota bacterium]